MVIQHFLRWSETAQVGQRAAAANALARAYILSPLSFEDRCAAEAALTLLLDDPSPIVRQAMAEALSLSPHAPRQIIDALANDQPEVAAAVIVRSPLLGDADLIDRVAAGDDRIQALIASRPVLSRGVCAAIAEVGCPRACEVMLANSGATVAGLTFRRIVERLGDLPAIRRALLADPRVPADVRHLLIVSVGEALARSPLVAAVIGAERAEKVRREACVRASLTLVDATPAVDLPALVEHLRLRGDLTASFMIRAVAYGKIDFFGTGLVALTGQGHERIRALLTAGREIAMRAAFRNAGLPDVTHGVILTALKAWREVASGSRMAGPQEITWLMLQALDATPGQPGPREGEADLAGLIKSIHLDVLRENARGHARAIAQAA